MRGYLNFVPGGRKLGTRFLHLGRFPGLRGHRAMRRNVSVRWVLIWASPVPIEGIYKHFLLRGPNFQGFTLSCLGGAFKHNTELSYRLILVSRELPGGTHVAIFQHLGAILSLGYSSRKIVALWACAREYVLAGAWGYVCLCMYIYTHIHAYARGPGLYAHMHMGNCILIP